jgi:ABC-type uncharacterized transport system permease subunit
MKALLDERCWEFLVHKIYNILRPLGSVALGLLIGSLVAWVAGENPLAVLKIMGVGVFGSPYDVGMTLYYATILSLTGLAVAVPFRCGVFNIGGEGQLLIGAFCAAIVASQLASTLELSSFQLSPGMHVLIVVVSAGLAGGVWGSVAGWIRAYRGGHEVISSIMLNFIAAALTSWLTLSFFLAPNSQSPETQEIDPAYMLSKWAFFEGSPVTSMLLMAFALSVLLWSLYRFHSFGFKQNATKSAERAAEIGGIDISRQRFLAMTLGGVLAGLAGAAMVMSSAGKFRLDMSDGFGFMGIPVALLAKGHMMGTFFAAILFAALHHGASALDLEAQFVTRDLALIIQAIVVVIVVVLQARPIGFRKTVTRGNT